MGTLAEPPPEPIVSRNISILRLSTRQWEELHDTRRGGSRFSLTFGHEIAHAGPRNSLVLLAIGNYAWDKNPDDDWFVDLDNGLPDEPQHRSPFAAKHSDSESLKIGLIRSVQAISTLDSRVVFDLIQPIKPDSLNALLSRVTRPALRSTLRTLGSSDARYERVSTKLGEDLIHLIAEEPENLAALRRIDALIRAPRYIRDARAMQQDALKTALKAFGATDAAAASLELTDAETALGTVRLREDAVIEHDARAIPGWELDSSYMTGRATFLRNGERLEVFTANKQPLEELFGVDLIYLNHAREALIMVQYKMMEPQRRGTRMRLVGSLELRETDEPEWVVPIDRQFKDELVRMRQFDKDLSVRGPFRLNSGAFFFKLVKRYASVDAAAIILSLGHLNQLMTEGGASGPRGGLRISYHSLKGHYLRGEVFVELIRSGYIGTRGATTQHLHELIEAAVNGGRAVVAAIQSVMVIPDPSVGHISDIDPTEGMERPG